LTRLRLGLALACGLAAACALRRPTPLVVPATLPPLVDDADPASLATAIDRTRPVWERAGVGLDAGALVGTSDPDARRAAVAARFRGVRVRKPVLVTAYFEPELPARLVPDAVFRYPLYGRPPDLVEVDAHALDGACACRPLAGRLDGDRLRPYPARGEIDAGALAGRGLEVAWLADPIDRFVLHVQGSGRLRLDDGRTVAVRYAGTNGRPYRSIVPALVERRLLAAGPTTLPAIRRALAALSPEEQASVLATDERYVFFRLAEGGAVGSAGVELTPGRSIAADPRLVPPGTVGYLVTPSMRRIVVAQDTGAAIVGPHVDVFLGAGADAEARAGAMHERGTLYLLVPR
jgi:membrane-bound lytic murein transglycosylase A